MKSSNSGGIATIGFLAVICAIIYIPIYGWHYQTGAGEHTGYITAVEKTGIFFKTYKVYVKTDVQSAQEDTYCVVDPNLYSELENMSDEGTHVTVSYISWLVSGFKYCDGEGAVITDVNVFPYAGMSAAQLLETLANSTSDETTTPTATGGFGDAYLPVPTTTPAQ